MIVTYVCLHILRWSRVAEPLTPSAIFMRDRNGSSFFEVMAW